MCSCFRHPLFQLLRMKNLRLPTIIILLFFGVNIITFYFSICKGQESTFGVCVPCPFGILYYVGVVVLALHAPPSSSIGQ